MVKRVKPELNIKKWVLAGLAILAAALVVFLVSSWVWFVNDFKTYQSKEKDVVISYPKTWTVREAPLQDVVVGFYAPKEHALDTFLENVNLSVFDMSNNILSIDEYATLMIEQMNTLFKDLKLVEKGIFFISGNKGYRMVLKPASSAPLSMVVYVFTKEDTGFNLLYIGANERYRTDRFMLDAMALSLKVKY